MYKKLKHKQVIISSFISLIIAFLLFFFLFGPSINPFYTDWIYNTSVDVPLNYLGFAFYRKAPWCFPVGMFNTLSYPVYNSILNTDSIPLFAIFFKIFNKHIPDNFQYLGLFVLFSFLLQSVLGMLICRKYTPRTFLGETIAILGGTFFILMPIFIILPFWHTSNCAHWLYLLSLIPFVYYDSLDFKKKVLIFSVVGFLSTLVTGYFTAICGIVVIGLFLAEVISTKKLKTLLIPIAYFLFSFISFFLVNGSFSINAFKGVDLEENAANITNFIDSADFFNISILPALFPNHFNNIGFAYLGLGILSLCFIVFSKILYDFIRNKSIFTKPVKIQYIMLIIISFILIFISLSPKAFCGNILLYELKLSPYIINIWSIFRCTGRFIHIVDYIILISALSFIISKFKTKSVFFFLFFALFIQIYDMHVFLYQLPKIHFKNISPIKMIDIDKWNDLAKTNKIKTIYTTMDFNNIITHNGRCIDAQYELGVWALKNNLRLNNFYFARASKNIQEYYKQAIENPQASDIFLFTSADMSKEYFIDNILNLNYFYNIDDTFLIASKVKLDINSNIIIEYSKQDIITNIKNGNIKKILKGNKLTL